MMSAILLFGVWLPVSAEASQPVYAVPINNYAVKRTGLIGGSVFPLDGYSLSGETADRLLPWDISNENLSRASTAVLSFTSMLQPLCGSSGIMFYLSVPAENTVAFVLELKNPEDSSRWKYNYVPELSPQVGKEYMLLRDGASAWESGSFVGTFAGSSYKGGIRFENAFSGFVKIPYSSLKNDSGFQFDPEKDVLRAMPFRFSKVGGNYGAITAAPLLLVAEDGDAPSVVLPDEYKKFDPVTAYAFNDYKINSGDLSYNTVYLTESGTAAAYELYTSSVSKVSQLCYTGMTEPLDGTDGIMIYLNLPDSNEITLSFTLNDPGSERWHCSYPAQMLLYGGTEYLVLPDGAESWETRTVTNADNGSKYRGKLCFDSAFSGYVIIPYQSFKNDSGFTLLAEQDTLFDLNISLSQMSASGGKITAWGGLKPAGNALSAQVSVYRRGRVAGFESANGTTGLSRTVAAYGERVVVTVSPDSGYRLAADGLKAVYTDLTGEKQILIVNKGDTETKGEGSGRSFCFLMPCTDQVTVTAEYTEYGDIEPALLEPATAGSDSIRFGMRLYSSDKKLSCTGFLLTNQEKSVLSHDSITDGVIDVPCSVKSDETAPDENSCKYTDYTLLLEGISHAEMNYTARGYAAYYDGGALKYVYTKPFTVSLSELNQTLFPEMKSFGEIAETKSDYCHVNTVQSPVTELANAKAMSISANTEQQCAVAGTQDSIYWSSASYAPFSLDGITDIMFYVKVPEKTDNNLYVVFTDSSGNSYKLWGDRTYMTLQKSESSWNEKKTQEGKDRTHGLIELSAGFEGFVKIPLTSLYIAAKLNGSSFLNGVLYRFSYIGDDSAPVTVGPVFGLYGEARQSVKPTVLADLPEATANARVYTDKNEVFATSGIFYWEATDNAESYLITAYRTDCGYTEASSYRVYSNSGAVTGLAANTDYTVQITACDSKEKAISYYEPFAITTAVSEAPAASENTAESFSAPRASAESAALSYQTLSADHSALLDGNPNRGLRGCMEFYHFNLSDAELYAKLNGYIKSSRFTSADCPIYVCYLYPGDYRGGTLDGTFFATVQKIFDFCREKQIQLLLRFAYYDVNHFNDRTPTTDEILSHIDQIADNGIISRNADVLHTFQAGFVGRFGEWHSENEPADRSAVLSAFVEKLLPDGVYSQLRMQKYKQYLPESADRTRFGIHLDSYFGIMDGSELGSGSFSYGNAEWEECVAEAQYAPNDAELYYWDQYNSSGVYCEGYAAAIGAKQLRLTTLSGINGYFDSGIYSESCMSQWKKLPVTAEWLKFNALPYSDGWFKASDGSAVSRNVFEYIRDFLGYRISATALTASAAENRIDVSLNLENHGLSAAFNTESALCLIDSQGNVVSETAIGNPSEWVTGAFTLSASLEPPESSGVFSVALKITSKSGANARLDNDIPFTNGYNILYEFTKG